MKILFFLLFFSSCLVKPVFAQKFFNEDFSSGLEKWELVNGEMSYWQIRDSALYATLNKSSRMSTIVPKSEFWQEIKEYDAKFIFKSLDDTDKNFVAGMRDSSNFYDFHFYGNQLIIEDIRNGFSLNRIKVPFTLLLNKNYLIHLIYSKKKIELFIDEQKVFSTDNSWQPAIYGGKFGFKISTGAVAHSQAYFDQLEIKELNSNDVLFKQNDLAWADKIYDKAQSWSNKPYMSNWACALSSAAMMLRNYGYHSFLTEEEINPWSLNKWLLSQNDGYIAYGLVNWLAISRLSKILSDFYGNLFPKLEYSYFKGSEEENLTLLQENLVDNQVQIAQREKHFFLVTDYLTDKNDFSIKDPLYEEHLLSQNPQKIDSLRIFRPSFTDLSYLLLVLPKNLNFYLTDELAKEIEDKQIVSEEIQSEEERIGDNYQLVYFKKPNSGVYNLLLTGDFNQELIDKTRMFIYQQSGEVQAINLNELLSKDQNLALLKQLIFKINYQKESSSEVSLQITEKTEDEQKLVYLNNLSAQAKTDFENNKLSFYLFYQLNLLIDSLRDHLDYVFLIEKFLAFHRL